jgi:hypothetical protein
MDMVRRQRETGMKGLGQVLKSFRDRDAEFSVYDRTSGADAYLHTLGALEMPAKGSRRGQAALDPRAALGHVERPDIQPHNFSVFHGKTGAD